MSEERIKILLVEDDEDDYLIARELLNEIGADRFRLDWVSSYEEGLARIAERAHDVYLIDYRIGANTGLELLAEAHKNGCHAPLILLTGQADREIDVASMRAGAADYLIKGQINAQVLERSIRYSIERARNLAALHEREAQLLQSQKMEAIGRLAGGVAHDFNNLLTAITGYTELLLDRVGDQSELLHDIQEIKNAADRAAALTRQLLTFSRKQVIEPKVLDLNRVVEGLEPMLRRLIGEHITLSVRCDPSVAATVMGDPGQMEQVVVNLVVNARDAMPEGGQVAIEVRVEDCPPTDSPMAKGACVRLSVIDTGRGMDERVMGRLFEPFFTTKGPDKGTGLGLSTIYAIVQRSRGHIHVVSEVGRGSRFDVYFPRTEAPVGGRDDTAHRDDGPAPSATVLLVEDQPLVRKLVRRLLRAEGYHVLEAEHGADALRVSESFSGPIDLLMTDVVMPQMNGDELAVKLAKTRPSTRVLFVSGYTDQELFTEHLDQRQHFLQKPFSPEVLSAKVRQVLSGND